MTRPFRFHPLGWLAAGAVVGIIVLTGAIFGAENWRLTLRIRAYVGYADPCVEQFKHLVKEKFGVDLTIDLTVAETPQDLYEAAKNKRADLISPSNNLFKSKVWPFLNENLVLPLPIDQIPNYQYVLPIFQYSQFVTENDQVYGTPLAAGPYGLAYNEDLVEEEPTSWNVLWDERYQGKYSISADYPECNIYVTALALGANYDLLYDPATLLNSIPLHQLRSKLNALAKNAFSFWKGTANVEEMDELALITTWGYEVQQANQKGLHWKLANPKEGVIAWLDHWAITSAVEKDSLKYKVCLEWLNFSLSPDVQGKVVSEWGNTPVVGNLMDHYTDKEIEIFKIGNQDFWKKVSLWGIIDPLSLHTAEALWNYAMSQKQTPVSKFVSQKDARSIVEEESVNRLARGKQLAEEQRQLRGLGDRRTGYETVIFPQSLYYQLTLYSISSGMTRNEIVLKAVEEYLANHPQK